MQNYFAIKEILFTEEQIQQRVKELASDIDHYYQTHYATDQEPILAVCIAKGAAYFCTDLTRHLEIPIELGFMSVSSYGQGTTSSGNVRITQDLLADVTGRHVLIIEDIVDTGFTLEFLLNEFKRRGAASVKCVALLSKPARRKVDVNADFTGFESPNVFVVGYGMDIGELCRELRYIAVLDEEKIYGDLPQDVTD